MAKCEGIDIVFLGFSVENSPQLKTWKTKSHMLCLNVVFSSKKKYLRFSCLIFLLVKQINSSEIVQREIQGDYYYKCTKKMA